MESTASLSRNVRQSRRSLLVSMVLYLMAVGVAHGAIRYVDRSTGLKASIAAAADNDVLELESGVWDGLANVDVIVTTSLTIKAEDPGNPPTFNGWASTTSTLTIKRKDALSPSPKVLLQHIRFSSTSLSSSVGCLVIEDAIVEAEDVSFVSCLARPAAGEDAGGVAVLSSLATATFTRASFADNAGDIRSSGSKLTVIDSTFSNSGTLNGGVRRGANLFARGAGSVTIDTSTFDNSSVLPKEKKRQGSHLVTETDVVLSVESSVFKGGIGNDATGALLEMRSQGGTISFTNVTAELLRGSSGAMRVLPLKVNELSAARVNLREFTLRRCFFAEEAVAMTFRLSSPEQLLDNLKSRIELLSIADIRADGLLRIDGSWILFNWSLYHEEIPLVDASDTSILPDQIRGIQLNNVITATSGVSQLLQHLTVANLNLVGSFYSLHQVSNVTLVDCHFSGIATSNASPSALFADECGVTIRQCSFKHNSNRDGNGGSIGVSNSVLDIRDTTFSNNSAPAGKGGALIIDSLPRPISINDQQRVETDANGLTFPGPVKLDNVAFVMNTAFQGGAIAIAMTVDGECEKDQVPKDIALGRFISFSQNAASNGGGAVFVLDSPPRCTFRPFCNSCTFSGNAAAYGPDEASGPSQLKLVPASDAALIRKTLTIPDIGNTAISSGISFMRPYVEVHPTEDDRFVVLAQIEDILGQLVVVPEGLSLDLQYLNEGSLNGQSCSTTTNGKVEFSGLWVKAPPLQIGEVAVQVRGFAFLSTSFEVRVAQRCPAGYRIVLRSEGASANGATDPSLFECERCLPGSYNLLSGVTCHECPAGALCLGGTSILTEYGHFQRRRTVVSDTTEIPGDPTSGQRLLMSSASSDDILVDVFSCPTETCCSSDTCTLDSQCVAGHGGLMCSRCLSDYTLVGLSECSICDGTQYLVWSVVAIGSFALATILLSMNPKKVSAEYLRAVQREMGSGQGRSSDRSWVNGKPFFFFVYLGYLLLDSPVYRREVIAIFSFSPELVSSSSFFCLGQLSNIGHRETLIGIGFFPIAAMLTIFSFARVIQRIRRTNSTSSAKQSSTSPGAYIPEQEKETQANDNNCGKQVQGARQLLAQATRNWTDSCALKNAVLRYFTVTYMAMGKLAIELVHCAKIDGRSTLVLDPEVHCYTPEHRSAAIVGWLTVLFWLLLPPLWLGYAIRSRIANAIKPQNDFELLYARCVAELGPVFTCFRPGQELWCIFDYWRRLMVVLIWSLSYNDRSARATLILVFCWLLQFVYVNGVYRRQVESVLEVLYLGAAQILSAIQLARSFAPTDKRLQSGAGRELPIAIYTSMALLHPFTLIWNRYQCWRRLQHHCWHNGVKRRLASMQRLQKPRRTRLNGVIDSKNVSRTSMDHARSLFSFEFASRRQVGKGIVQQTVGERQPEDKLESSSARMPREPQLDTKIEASARRISHISEGESCRSLRMRRISFSAESSISSAIEESSPISPSHRFFPQQRVLSRSNAFPSFITPGGVSAFEAGPASISSSSDW